jgi:TrmH RNA methyltransferase
MSVTRDPLDRVYGLAAALAAFEARPEAVARIAHTEEQRFALRDVLREAAQRRIAYREVPPDELSRMCESQHHEGVCVWVRRGRAASLADAIAAVGARGAMFALDAVENPHNVGAIVRTAAYFGVASLLVQTEGGRPLPASALRIAEGGSEHVCVAVGSSLPRALAELRRAGFQIVGTDVRGGEPLGAHQFGDRTVIVLGNERSGLSEDVHRMCDEIVMIPGADNLDSLNVSVAAGILAYELHMQLSASTL